MALGGRREGAGRPIGSQSKIGQQIRQALHEALDAVGGVEYLKDVAKTNPQVFCSLVSKIIPAEIEVKHSSIIDDMGTDDIARLAELLGARIKGNTPGIVERTDLPPPRPIQTIQ